MNCDEAENLICARLDGELPANDPSAIALDAHLAECAGCRAGAEAVQVQDAALVRAFAPARRSAEAVAERVMAAARTDEAIGVSRLDVTSARASPSSWLRYLLAGVAAAAIVLFAVTFGERFGGVSPPQVISPATQPATQSAGQPIAEILLSTGEVFTCPSHGPADAWQPAAPGVALGAGDRVRTAPAARVELRLADGSQVRLNGGTEARLGDARRVELTHGQLWSAVPAESQPLRVIAPPLPATAAGGTVTAITPPGSRLDVACEPSGRAVLTAVQGPANVTDTLGAETQVPPGSAMTFVAGLASGQTVTGDVFLATQWFDDLLVLKGGDDPELAARVAELLSRIERESAAATRPAPALPMGPGPVEQGVRAAGAKWCEPFACHVRSPGSQVDRGSRLTAARLLADLAPPSAIPDLIALLADRDGDVRFHAARALHRLTGQDLGRSPDQCATDGPERVRQTHAAWHAWWEQNKSRYAAPARKT